MYHQYPPYRPIRTAKKSRPRAALFCGAYIAPFFSLLRRSAPKETLGLSKKLAALRVRSHPPGSPQYACSCVGGFCQSVPQLPASERILSGVSVGHCFILRGCPTVMCLRLVVERVVVGHFGGIRISQASLTN